MWRMKGEGQGVVWCPQHSSRSFGEPFFRVMSPKWQSLIKAMTPFRALDSAAM